jgi:catechol 2,3-dioxygenase-like lactoylglutathione lyase family enzyme
MSRFLQIDHVQIAIPAGSEQRAREFYTGILEFDEMPKPLELADRGGAWFRSGSVALHLGIDQEFQPAKKAHPALLCTDYDGLIAHLGRKGVTVIPGEHLFRGKAHCYIADPFGNRIELIAS